MMERNHGLYSHCKKWKKKSEERRREMTCSHRHIESCRALRDGNPFIVHVKGLFFFQSTGVTMTSEGVADHQLQLELLKLLLPARKFSTGPNADFSWERSTILSQAPPLRIPQILLATSL
jgi:hypothetical protein